MEFEITIRVYWIVCIMSTFRTNELDRLIAYLTVLFYLQGVSTVSTAIDSQELLRNPSEYLTVSI